MIFIMINSIHIMLWTYLNSIKRPLRIRKSIDLYKITFDFLAFIK